MYSIHAQCKDEEIHSVIGDLNSIYLTLKLYESSPLIKRYTIHTMRGEVIDNIMMQFSWGYNTEWPKFDPSGKACW